MIGVSPLGAGLLGELTKDAAQSVLAFMSAHTDANAEMTAQQYHCEWKCPGLGPHALPSLLSAPWNLHLAKGTTVRMSWGPYTHDMSQITGPNAAMAFGTPGTSNSAGSTGSFAYAHAVDLYQLRILKLSTAWQCLLPVPETAPLRLLRTAHFP